jgi:hypothetical protein
VLRQGCPLIFDTGQSPEHGKFVDQVIPILRKRGPVRHAYAGTTFRENLLPENG